MRTFVAAALPVIMAPVIMALPALGQPLPLNLQQQQQAQLLYQQGQIQRQQQVIDHAIIQQQNADAAARNQADLSGQSARAGSPDFSEAARVKGLTDQAARNGQTAMPAPLQLLPQ